CSQLVVMYLSATNGVSINAATFQFCRLPDGSELLARVFLIEPSEVELKTRTKGGSKRRSNLSYEELEAQANEAGVRGRYDRGVASLWWLIQVATPEISIKMAVRVSERRNRVK